MHQSHQRLGILSITSSHIRLQLARMILWEGNPNTGGKLRARLCGIRAQTNRNMAASGPIQPSKLRANWCNVSARLFLECLDFWKWRVVCLGCFVHLCSSLFPSISSKLSYIDWLILKSHEYLDIQLDRLVLCGLHGSIGSLRAIGQRQHHTHTHVIDQTSFIWFQNLFRNCAKMVDLFSNCNQLRRKYTVHTPFRETLRPLLRSASI